MTTIAENIKIVKQNIEKACFKVGRSSSDVLIVAITKTVEPIGIREAFLAGITDIGENRIQESLSKFEKLKDLPINWHLVGHLQTNKVNQALQIFKNIQSVDSLKIAQAISSRTNNDINVMIEVNTSGEDSKFGVKPENTIELAKEISKLPHLKLIGLMTIGPNTDNEASIRSSFKSLRTLYDSIKVLNLPAVQLKCISMGMSSDYEIAVEEGSTLVRIGSAIFGER